MKKVLLVFLLSPLLFGSFNLMAQSWVNGGNALTANGTLGTNNNFSVLFKTNNGERGRITNSGLWGIGTTVPNSKVHINSATGQVPFRVQVNGNTKLLVHSAGGVSIGTFATPPTNGLLVAGNTGIGTATPENTLHVFKGSAGAVTGNANSPLIVENSTNSYINILAPDAFETGILFGKPASNVSGGIIYNSGADQNGLQFRVGGNNQPGMTLTTFAGGSLNVSGNIAIANSLSVGTSSPDIYKLKISHLGAGLGIENGNTFDVWELVTQQNLDLFSNNVFRGSFSSVSGAYSSISDERLKTNIKPMSAMLQKIMQLKPSAYQFKNATDKQEYNGFIAQDVMKLFPAMVTHTVNPERKLDIYTLDYSQFGVLAIKGIQELQPLIEEQKQINEQQKLVNEEQKLKIATLEDRLAKLEALLTTITANGNFSTIISNTSLEQNKPNPFDKTTTIRYRIPPGSKGKINIYDQTGKMVKALNANQSGQSELSGYDLLAGVYTYTLMINDKVALSKKMLITK